MCGVTGLWDRRGRLSAAELGRLCDAMTETLRHRGPDDSAVWSDAEAGFALGHRRLSIIDLTPTGAQPMHSSCGRFVLSYNGEIYNAAELRPELEAAGRRFRGTSDTEVIVEGFAIWGVEPTLARLIGMFAMALWDRRERALYLIRDRLGIKPMYWTEQDGRILFGSELKALRADPDWQPALDRAALAAYLRLGYLPAAHTIYRGVSKLAPGTILTLRATGAPELRSFWSLADVARAGQASRIDASEEEAADRLDALLGDAVRRRMVADVPLGAFLSGGIDSSTVVALMQKNSAQPVRSFSIGFREAGYDEAPQAAAVARHLGTDHTELYVSPEHAREVIPRLPEIYDEPFADPSQIPTFLVSELTRRHVKVALSGDGGDELFAGYSRYFRGQAVLRALEHMPRAARGVAAAGLRAFSPAAWATLGQVLPERHRPRQFGDKLQKLAGVLDEAHDVGGFYRSIISQWSEPERVVRDAIEAKTVLDDAQVAALVPDAIERMQYLDTRLYLPDDILTKLDRASMAVSLEARVPILDHRIVAFSWTLPPALKARGNGKRLLRRVLHRYVPEHLVERPKMGFGVPIDSWLRGPLRQWAEDLLDERRLTADGIFDPAPIRERWRAHLQGTRNWQYPLWTVLMFQAWKARWMG